MPARGLACLALLLGLLVVVNTADNSAWAAARPSCVGCHKDFRTLLPGSHPAVSGKDIGACLACHPSSDATEPKPNPVSARLHRAHLVGKARVECTVCHAWTPGKRFGLPRQKVNWGKPSRKDLQALEQVFQSWATSSFLDALHAKQNVTCGGCHEKKLPEADDAGDDDRCVSCHGDYEKLVQKTPSSPSAKWNPHKSHLVGLSCGKCHRVHQASQVYCLQCHKTLEMTIPGGAAKK